MNLNKVVKFLKNLSYKKWINFLLPPSSIIILTLLGILMKFSLVNNRPIAINEWLIFMTIYFVIIVIPYDLIRWLLWGRKKYYKKIYARLQIIRETETLLKKAKELSSLVNETTNRYIFEESLSELKTILSQLIKYEKYDFFSGSKPSKDLEELLEKESKARIAFKAREIISSQSGNKEHIQSNNYDDMSGHDFEYFCADILIKNGFNSVSVTPGSGDHGIDILAEKDDITYAIQCKCYTCNIGNAAIQQALAGKKFYKRDVAVVLTNQYFTQQAKDEASVFGVKLWDRDKLDELIENIKK